MDTGQHGDEASKDTRSGAAPGDADGRPESRGEAKGEAKGELKADKAKSVAKAPARKKPSSGSSRSGGVLPKVASEDDPRSWGDRDGYDHDAWLKEQRPPHWG